MPLHYTNELTFDLPEPLIDVTHHIFSLTEEGPSEFTIVINHHTPDQDETLHSYGCRLTAEMEKNLPQYRLHASGQRKVAEQDALWLIYSWVQNDQFLQQAQVSFFLDNDSGNRHVVQITATALGTFTDEWKQRFEAFLATVKKRQEQDLAVQQ